MTLSRDSILSAQDLPREAVDVPEWGGIVYVRVLTAAERDAWETSLLDAKRKADTRNARAALLVRCLINDQGERLFADSDAELLGAKSSNAVDRCYAVAERLNLLRPQDLEAAKKNS